MAQCPGSCMERCSGGVGSWEEWVEQVGQAEVQQAATEWPASLHASHLPQPLHLPTCLPGHWRR